MNDRRINNLVRMAMEVEQLEADASTPALRFAVEPVVVRERAWFASGAGMAGLGLAAAAGLALVFALPAMLRPAPIGGTALVTSGPAQGNHEIGTAAPEAPVIVHHLRETPINDHDLHGIGIPQLASAADRVDPGNVERSMVMAIYRGSRGQMQCVKMKPHEWSENKCLTEVTPQELKCVSVGQPCTVSADHALMVALSGPQKSLPRNDSEAVHLATCILGSPCENDSRCLSLTAAQCVPDGVSVKIETVVDSR